MNKTVTPSPSLIRDLTLALAVSLATALACIVLVRYVDTGLANYFKFTFDRNLRAAFYPVSDLGNAGGYIALFAIVYLGATTLQKRSPIRAIRGEYEKLKGLCLFIFATLASSAALIHLLKLIAGRPRPKLFFQEGLEGFHWFAFNLDWNSFPSGHTQTVWAVVTPLLLIYPRWRAPLILMGTLIASARMVISAHYPSDLLMALVLTVLAALILRRHVFTTLEAARFGEHLRALEQDDGREP